MLHTSPARLWKLAEGQHGVVARSQLLDLGLSPDAIKNRVVKGRLHPVWRGVYAVGRPQLTRRGRWMAAVLSCGPDAALSHGSAAALWEIGNEEGGRIKVSVPARALRRRRGIVVHRRATIAGERTVHDGIPVTAPVTALIDIALRLSRVRLEAAINDADKRGLANPEELRNAIDTLPRRPGIAR